MENTNPTTELGKFWDSRIKTWDAIKNPLKPCAEDIEIMEGMIKRHNTLASPRVLILGVTPQIALMRYPEGARVTGSDNSMEMIRHCWPLAPHMALHCNWMTLPELSCDIVIGDGIFPPMKFPETLTLLMRSICGRLAPEGLVIMRLFSRPRKAESIERVFEDMWAGRIGNFHYFKWRLMMALEGRSLGEAWRVWRAYVPHYDKLASALGWPMQEILTIDSYRDRDEIFYSFPTAGDVTEVFSPGLELIETVYPNYEDSERYPTVCFRRRTDAT